MQYTVHIHFWKKQSEWRNLVEITRQAREQLKGHAGKVVWFTGLSGAGKTTLASALEQALHAKGKHTYLLDGDMVRQGLSRDLGFSAADRTENIRRVTETARLMMDAGLIVLVALISPFRQERALARSLIGQEHFVEVFVDTPLSVCESRDPKGLYRKARCGLISEMTGIDSPYEPPCRPDITIRTMEISVSRGAAMLLDRLESMGSVHPAQPSL